LEYLSDELKKPFKDAKETDIRKHLEKYKPRTQNQRIITFKEFYRWLFNCDENQPSPDCIKKIKPRNITIDDVKYAERVVTPEEYTLLIENCNNPMQKAILECLWITGGRKTGIQEILSDDVSFDGSFTRIKLRIDKVRPREVVHPGRAEHLLKWSETLSPNAGKKGEPLFVHRWRGGCCKIEGNYAWILLNRLCKKVGIRHIKTHDLRHSRCTYLLKDGIPETHVKTMLGFSKSTRMFSIYDHNRTKDYEDFLTKKQQTIRPTYQLLEQQKKALETKHEGEIKNLQEQMANIMKMLEIKQQVEPMVNGKV
jgi:site-specific recombinase XerD